ncbi:MAG TPA: hypothetical protein EYP22_10820 [Methanosarcinales archaeon]|nr:hypothetical protein [Methanosarcinales archaeon]
MKCPLCGYSFNKENAEKVCRNCPLRFATRNCKIVKCPNCGYEFIMESRIINWIRSIIHA